MQLRGMVQRGARLSGPDPNAKQEAVTSAKTAWRFGTDGDSSRLVRTHLFGIGANNSGTTFLKNALSTSQHTWNLPAEGQFAAGFAGPRTSEHGRLLWTCGNWGRTLRDPAAYDWPRTRRVWHRQAFARGPAASVFFTKAPPFLFHVESLRAHFPKAKFIFTVRNPYAVCQGMHHYRIDQPLPPGKNFFEAAAEHVVSCLAQQRRNVEAHVQPGTGVFFTYETMCDEPARAEALIRSLAPELDDLNLRQRLRVKGVYDEMLTNMNPRQLARLDAEQIQTMNRVFKRHRALLAYFGYELMHRPVAERSR